MAAEHAISSLFDVASVGLRFEAIEGNHDQDRYEREFAFDRAYCADATDDGMAAVARMSHHSACTCFEVWYLVGQQLGRQVGPCLSRSHFFISFNSEIGEAWPCMIGDDECH